MGPVDKASADDEKKKEEEILSRSKGKDASIFLLQFLQRTHLFRYKADAEQSLAVIETRFIK